MVPAFQTVDRRVTVSDTTVTGRPEGTMAVAHCVWAVDIIQSPWLLSGPAVLALTVWQDCGPWDWVFQGSAVI